MATAELLLRASVFALLVLHAWSIPVKSGYGPQAYGGSSYSKGAPPADEFTPAVEETPDVEEDTDVEENPDVEVSYSLPPPEPVYQAGELSHYVNKYEFGDYQRETEEEGSLPPPPPPLPAKSEKKLEAKPVAKYTSEPRPLPGRGRGYFPYFNYNFLYGNYPTGTYTHASSSFEQGRDYWRDAHYVKYPYYEPVAVEEPEPSQDAQVQVAPVVQAPQYEEPAGVKYPRKVGY